MSQETIRTSPSRVTRVQEKEELAQLNDRFLHYIEQVRSMKETNLRLEMELVSTKEQLGSESAAVKALYETELKDARSLIDETAKERARQQLLANNNANRIEELEAELKKLKDGLDRLESKYNAAERNANSFDAQRKSAIADKSKLQKQVKDLEDELAELRDTYESVKASLESETLMKVDLQNHIQSLKEEMVFRKKVYEEELASLREKLSISMSGTMETDFQAQLDSRLEIAIDELRERSEADIADYKAQIEAAYNDKITALENQSMRDASTITKLNMELKKITSSKNEQSGEIARLQKTIDRLESALRDKEEELGHVRRQHADEMAHRLEELRELRESYEIKIREYEELMGIKIQLDQEIATYRALLQEEETRLNLTPTPREKRTRSRTSTQTESVSKKARLDTAQQKSCVTSNAAGHIHITGVDPDGRYIQIQNTSDNTEAIGGLKISHEVEGESDMVFRFHNKSKLQGGASVTVWSDDAEGSVHNPPTDLVWKNQGWSAGNKTVTKLIKGGEEVAWFSRTIEISPIKQRREQTDAGTGSLDSSTRSFPQIPVDTERDSGSRTTRVTTTTYTTTSSSRGRESQKVGGEHMFHQKGDPDAGEKQNCIIS